MLSFWEKNDLAPSEIPLDSWSATVVMLGKYPFSSFYLGGHFKLFHRQQNLHDKKNVNYTAYRMQGMENLLWIFFLPLQSHILSSISSS